ncbi:MAG: hypothetical protein KBT88_07865 [Gammaproteobacteria bacterium]|nr:hypothetical protein [Gammaproteobacteria bacterium]MBQ0839688.1 hypothetical protein [Gammaproteobacteria bacterium]
MSKIKWAYLGMAGILGIASSDSLYADEAGPDYLKEHHIHSSVITVFVFKKSCTPKNKVAMAYCFTKVEQNSSLSALSFPSIIDFNNSLRLLYAC